MTSTLTPLGWVSLTEADGVITGLHWNRAAGETSPLLSEALAQITAYFDGRLTQFDLPLAAGDGFQAPVRRAMAAIPYGETRTYGDLARAVSAPAQAIGQACGANPMPILIPCHRVLGAKSLGGFSAPGGVESKVALLRLEKAAGLLI